MEGEDPEARKQRLKALKRAAQQAEGGQEPAEQPEEKPTLKLRNYKLRDKTIAHEQVRFCWYPPMPPAWLVILAPLPALCLCRTHQHLP